ncbi:MAG: hypothetical protein J5I93_26870 [Pirellulaceae bacterium]|nr:hypothetical protein [Pirellulaceae bacterium]
MRNLRIALLLTGCVLAGIGGSELLFRLVDRQPVGPSEAVPGPATFLPRPDAPGDLASQGDVTNQRAPVAAPRQAGALPADPRPVSTSES